ncbi:class I adenylate-forming enzyme family protein [Ferviditalea candida]|uniref:Class I adenylate-forming enzyme family protein n=1 Tax=Ferviditalea candida TaxID=3108399 RepID=A0ABU5ZMW0_9BACL|nr:class I adenylate-forming enzyme family protein [Paenibacillaceae bacterium T2]
MWNDQEKAGITRKQAFGRNLLVFSNRPTNLTDVLKWTVSRFPEREALVMGNERIQYRRLWEFTENAAAHLYHQYQIRKGERVALLLDNCIEFVIAFFACSRLGAIAVPLNTRLAQKEIAFMLKQSNSSILIADMEFAGNVEHAEQISPSIRHKFSVGGQMDGFTAFEALTSPAEPAPSAAVHEEDPLYIMYTSGTTGTPKGAVGSHLGIIHSVMCYARILKTSERDRSLDAVPLFHVTGLVGQLVHMIYVGGTNVLMRRFKADEFIRLLSEEKITFTFNVPTIYVIIMSHPLFKAYTYETVRVLAYGGAPMSPQTIHQLKQEFPGVHLHNAYGATETTSPTTVMPLHYQEKKLSSVGYPIPVIELKLVNERGQECGPSEVGELWIKGPNVVAGYWDNDEANKKSFAGDYWRSGDLAMKDEDGFIYIMDRSKDMINRGGEKIFSIEVENLLYSHAKVFEAAVVGVPDPVFGERVKAVIVPKPGTTVAAEEFKQFVRAHLADYKVPEIVEFCTELPRNPGGKILKSLLRETMHNDEKRMNG